MARFIDENFVPFTVNVKENPGLFHRFEAIWTPTVVVMSPKGIEKYRIEGYVPREEFRALLEMGIARVAFTSKRWDEAIKWYSHIADEHANAAVGAEATYWRAVCQYSSTHDPSSLGQVAVELKQKFPDSLWTQKASVWAAE